MTPDDLARVTIPLALLAVFAWLSFGLLSGATVAIVQASSSLRRIANARDLSAVREVRNVCTCAEANALMAQGWRLLTVAIAAHQNWNADHHYVLGRPEGV